MSTLIISDSLYSLQPYPSPSAKCALIRRQYPHYDVKASVALRNPYRRPAGRKLPNPAGPVTTRLSVPPGPDHAGIPGSNLRSRLNTRHHSADLRISQPAAFSSRHSRAGGNPDPRCRFPTVSCRPFTRSLTKLALMRLPWLENPRPLVCLCKGSYWLEVIGRSRSTAMRTQCAQRRDSSWPSAVQMLWLVCPHRKNGMISSMPMSST